MNGGDLTRSTFRADRHYSGVRMQQGRVQLDADWNEQLDVTAHRDRAESLDVIGPAGVPKVEGGFELTASADGTDLLLSPGRAWVAGHLCEADGGTTTVSGTPTSTRVEVDTLVLDGVELRPGTWVEVVGDSGTVVARATAVDVAADTVTLDASVAALNGDLRIRRLHSYAVQPDLPTPEHTTQASATDPRVLDLPEGSYLAYLDVWERSISSLDDAHLSEPALGTDTTTRSQVVWQVRLLDLAGVPDPVDCDTDLSAALEALAPSTGLMAARAEPPSGSTDLCRPTPAGGYVGLENQLYRVHVHDLEAGRPVVLWSRENASVATTWISSVATDTLQVASIGKDAVLGFQPGDWVELFDDACVLEARGGTLVRLLDAREDRLVLDVATATGSTAITDFPRNPQVRRWDSPGAVTVSGDDWVELENGVQVRFPSGGTFHRHDYWLVPARSVLADVDWPRDSGGEPLALPASGVRHDTGRLAIVTRSASGLSVADCRELFPSLTTLTADDVAVDNDVCDLAGVETVQDAIDALCRANDLRRHNRLLHGHGIVCGLAVHCGSGEDDRSTDDLSTEERRRLFREEDEAGALRRFVTVEPGSAIDADGNDLDVPEPIVVDVLREIEGLGEGVLDADGDGEVSLVLRPRGGGRSSAAVTRFVARTEREWLDGTLLNDIYEDCIAKPLSWVRAQLDPGTDADPRAYLLRTALTNLLSDVVNPQSSATVFVSASEHEVLESFYRGLRKRLASETFCAMFDDARPYPDYPASFEGLRTIAGTGNHDRARTRPGGDEVWTTGGGINPLQPSTMLNRYSLRSERLVSRMDPVSGLELEPGARSSTAAAAVTDLAFSPDGKLVAVAVPTRDGNDTFFRVGEIGDTGVRWRPATTICGVKLVTLATTDADADHVYAVGLRRTATEGKAFSLKEYTGAGVWQIPWGEVPDGLGPLESTATLNTVGHLAISPQGEAVFTIGPDGGTAERYDRLVSMHLPDRSGLRVTTLPGTGSDDVALVLRSEAADGTSAWVVTGSGRERQVTGIELASGNEVTRVGVGAEGRVALQAVRDRLLVTDSATSLARVLDTSRQELVDGLQIPVQVGPVSSTATALEARNAVVLNLVSNSLSVMDVGVVLADELDLEPLVDYRHAAVEAFADLVGGLAQYLKDCVCDHLLVRCPPRQENLDLDLAAVSIRGGSVYKVCNFSRRRYVKSFPTVGYWLSLVPVLPALRQVLGDFCCRVLTEYFGRYSTADRADARDRVDPARLLRFLQVAQDEDPLGRWRGSGLGSATSFLRGANSGDWGEESTPAAAPPDVQPGVEEAPTTPGAAPVFTRPATHEVILRNLLQSPVIREDLGIVRAQPAITGTERTLATGEVSRGVALRRTVAPDTAPDTSPEHLAALTERVSSLEQQIAALTKPAPKKRATRSKPTE
ncbi:DUF6519 domain-containing protein [Nocardioides taihuensis]|uniref:DUF6519 domain-containing protein n=1 Tax=Nocardioides taihuensis TaxID=1835606 RepID=A0ABW0BE39_9ACTN